MRNILYKIYYGDSLVYFGRTHQELEDRIRAHLFKALGLKVIDINMVTKIEYVELNTEADMFLYEIYYINKFKPVFNKDDKACDDLTAVLPDLTFKPWSTPLWNKWKEEIKRQDEKKASDIKSAKKLLNEYEKLEAMLRRNEIGEAEYQERKAELDKQEIENKYKKGEISLSEYCEKLGLNKI